MANKNETVLSARHIPFGLVLVGLVLSFFIGFDNSTKANLILLGGLQILSVHWFWYQKDHAEFFRSYKDSPAILAISLGSALVTVFLVAYAAQVATVLAIMVAVGCLTMPVAIFSRS